MKIRNRDKICSRSITPTNSSSSPTLKKKLVVIIKSILENRNRFIEKLLSYKYTDGAFHVFITME